MVGGATIGGWGLGRDIFGSQGNTIRFNRAVQGEANSPCLSPAGLTKHSRREHYVVIQRDVGRDAPQFGTEFAVLSIHQHQQVNIRFGVSVSSGFGAKEGHSENTVEETTADAGNVLHNRRPVVGRQVRQGMRFHR